MTTFFLELGNLDGLIYLIVAIMFGPAVVLTTIGLIFRKKHKKAAKVLFILAAIYVLISLGVCGSLIAS